MNIYVNHYKKVKVINKLKSIQFSVTTNNVMCLYNWLILHFYCFYIIIKLYIFLYKFKLFNMFFLINQAIRSVHPLV